MFVDTSGVPSRLNRGDEIVSIDGRTIDWWLAQIEPLIPVDGDANHVKPLVAAYSTEFMGPALDHFAPFINSINETAELEVRSPGEGVKKVRVSRQNYIDFQNMVGEKRYSTNFSQSVRMNKLKDNGAYLAVDSFINYREPVDAMAHLETYFKTLREEKRNKLILDLRSNGGGSEDAQESLLRHLISEPVRQVEHLLSRFNSLSDEQRLYLNTWSKSALNPNPDWFEKFDDRYYILKQQGEAKADVLEPAKYAFQGEIIVLTGPSNSSGSTHLIATLKAAGRITTVGERTGGAPTGATAGTLFFLTLPESGIRVRIPVLRTVIANSELLPERNGLNPDKLQAETKESFFAGRDPALEAARKMFDL